MHNPARVLWVTNNATPYRRPLWEQLGQLVDLTLVILESDRSLARRGDRGRDWKVEGQGLPVRRVPTVTVARGKDPVHVVLPWARPGVRTTDAVLIGGWDSPAYWQVLALAKLWRRRTVGFYESTLATNRFRTGPVAAARRFFFRRLDAVVTPGPAATEALRAMGVPADRIRTGFNAVDVDRFHAGAAAARGGEGAPAEGHRFVYVGRLIGLKNVDSLLRAFADVRRPHDLLSVVGTGPLEDELRALAVELGVQEQVEFVGHVDNDDLPTVLAAQHTLVLASHEDTWGLVVNEALAAGLHVVVNSAAGVYPSVRAMPGVQGCGTDPAQIADALRRSRDEWRGWVVDPPILAHTPASFAATFAGALVGAPFSTAPTQPRTRREDLP